MKKVLLVVLASFCFTFNSSITKAAEDEIGMPIEMLHWKEVNKILPRFVKFTVLDVETGMKFNVQRRAGRDHADVQPLTEDDTKIMKKIYNGKWSWKRRAIIIISDGEWIAASMHGMPHGAGALANNFPGHFCIHFYGSTTHRTNSMDLSHKLMILKAAGKLDEYAATANPDKVISAFIAGLKQQDPFVVSSVSLREMSLKEMSMIENANLASVNKKWKQQMDERWVLDIPVEVEWYIKNKGKKIYRGSIRVVRMSPMGPWKVDAVTFMEKNKFSKKKA